MAGLLKNEYEFDDYMNVCHLQIKGFLLFNHLQFIKKDCKLLFVPEYFNDKIYSCDIVLPKKVILYVLAVLFFKSTPSSLMYPFLKGIELSSILAGTRILASKPF